MSEPAGNPGFAGVPGLVRPTQPSSRGHWRIFIDALVALFIREVRSRYGTFRGGYVWAVVQPLAFVVIINESRALLGASRDAIYGVSGQYFFLIGVLPFFMYQQSFNQALGAMTSFRGVFNYREVRPIDIILVRGAIEFVLLGFVLMLTILGLHFFHQPVDFQDPLRFLAAIGLLFVLTQGLGLIGDVYATRSDNVRRIIMLMDRPLFFISGVFFTAEVVPEGLREYLMWNPLLHAIDLGRDSMLTEYDSPCSWLYLTLFAFSALMFGLGAYRSNLHRLSA